MKLMVCLTVTLSLVFAFWSSGIATPKESRVSEGCVVAEQLDRNWAPISFWWSRDGWVERVFSHCRRKKPRIRRYKKHKLGKLEFRLRKFRRWSKGKRRQWRCLWQRRKENVDNAKLAELASQEDQSTVPEQEASSMIESQVSNQASILEPVKEETVEETETAVHQRTWRETANVRVQGLREALFRDRGDAFL